MKKMTDLLKLAQTIIEPESNFVSIFSPCWYENLNELLQSQINKYSLNEVERQIENKDFHIIEKKDGQCCQVFI